MRFLALGFYSSFGGKILSREGNDFVKYFGFILKNIFLAFSFHHHAV